MTLSTEEKLAYLEKHQQHRYCARQVEGAVDLWWFSALVRRIVDHRWSFEYIRVGACRIGACGGHETPESAESHFLRGMVQGQLFMVAVLSVKWVACAACASQQPKTTKVVSWVMNRLPRPWAEKLSRRIGFGARMFATLIRADVWCRPLCSWCASEGAREVAVAALVAAEPGGVCGLMERS